MIKNEETYSIPIWVKIVLAFFALLLLFFLIFITLKYASSLTDGFIPDYPDRDEWGVFGDFFGGVLNPIFGFASFLALLATIFYQAKELNASTKELKNSATALSAQNRAIQLQSFEQTLFSWLDLYKELVNTYYYGEGHGTGRTAMNQLRVSKIGRPNDFGHQITGWANLYQSNESQLDNLFRTLYNLIFWIDSQNESKIRPEQKWVYISIVRSQLSWIEMAYLYLNGLTERGEKFKTLAEKYALFDNLTFREDMLLKADPIQTKYYLESAYNSELARTNLNIPKTAEATFAKASIF